MTPVFAMLDTPIIIIIAGLAVLLFGADRIPKLAKSMGEAKREFEAASRGQSPSATDATPPAEKPGDPSSQTPAQQ